MHPTAGYGIPVEMDGSPGRYGNESAGQGIVGICFVLGGFMLHSLLGS